jgi:hypothetical protein
MVRQGYPVELVERGNAPLLLERAELLALLEEDDELTQTTATIRHLRRVNPERFVAKLSSSPAEEALPVLWCMYREVRFTSREVVFVYALTGAEITRALPGYYGEKKRGAEWGW